MSQQNFKSLDDIVFENRNKEYGAFELRTNERSNLLKSFLFGLLFILFIVGGIFTYNTVFNRQEKTETVIDVNLTEIEQVEEIIEDKPEEPEPEPEPEPEIAEVKVMMPEPKKEVKVQETVPEIKEMDNKLLGFENKEGEETDKIKEKPTEKEKPKGDGEGKKPAPTGNFTAREVSEMAVFPGCEKFKGKKEDLQKCLAQKLNEQLGDQLSDFAETLNNRGESQAVAKLQFVIDKSGKIIQVKPMAGGSAELGKESKTALERIATRLSSSGKTIQPAKLEDGSPVNLVFQLPVKYVVQ